ncbi:MAG: sensor histidine kinase N-terminal domain-containing protein [Pseudomonadota bacterium]|jgi:two-component system sensor histidine kinase TctE
MAPLLVLVVASGAAAYGLASHFSRQVLDQWLYDSAISLAKQVRWVGGRASIDLPSPALEIFEWDAADRLFYEVTSQERGLIFSNALLAPPPYAPTPESAQPVYYDSEVAATPVRALAIALALPQGDTITVKVAETRHKRDLLAREVLVATLGVSLLMVAVCAGLVWYGIGSGMSALEVAVRDIRIRHGKTPLAPTPGDWPVPDEVRPLVDEINELIDELGAAHRSQERFVMDAAHQLRMPLAALRVQLEFAQRERDPERHARAIDNATEVLARTSHLLHQLLTLAKVDENRADTLGLEPTDIDRIAREEVERRVDDALAQGIDLGYAGVGRAVWVNGKDALLREALANLLDNALAYGAAGGQVTVGVCDDPLEIYVEDHGPGIAPAERARVRDRFYRVPGTPGDGCGLGLSIVDEIARRHGAVLSLEQRVGGTGLRARLLFPPAPDAGWRHG